jgi:glutamyl-tRNA reductase
MKFNETETLDEWAIRVQTYEQGRALMRLAEGHNVEEVLAEMSQRIVNKLKYPIVNAIHTIPSTYDAEASQESYKKLYLEKHNR